MSGKTLGVHNVPMGMFSRKEKTRAAKVSARARYVDADVQRVDVTMKDVEGDSLILELSLDQVRGLITDLTVAYSACRPALLSQKEDRDPSWHALTVATNYVLAA